jgi:hypothetical protein
VLSFIHTDDVVRGGQHDGIDITLSAGFETVVGADDIILQYGIPFCVDSWLSSKMDNCLLVFER